MIIEGLKITNSKGKSIEFGNEYRIADDFIMSGLQASVNYSESTGDGSNYHNTKLENRDFDLPFFIRKTLPDSFWIEGKRDESYSVFNPKLNPFRIDIKTKGGAEYYLNANLEGVPLYPVAFEEDNSDWQKGYLQFSCNDPFFYKSGSAQTVDIALFIADFEFPLEIPTDEGIQFGHRSESLIVNAYNEGQEETGMILRFRALGSLSNPSLTNVNTYQVLKVDIDMIGGDMIEISTFRRNKYVRLIREGVETDIFNQLDLESTFLQLDIGDNLFRYDADSGIENLEVRMNFVPKYLGV